MDTNKVAELEALLFIYGDPLTYKKISQILKITEDAVRELANALSTELFQDDRGLSLLMERGKIQLVTKGAFQNIAEEIIKEEVNEALTPATLETLSIVTYAGPISRAELDYIRGVNSTFALRNLLIRGLVDRASDPKRGNAFLYSPSLELLRYLGINQLTDLPDYEKFQDLIKTLRAPTEENKEEHTPEEIQSIMENNQ
ncbi:MAG: SMC-Scp complex subunit ScpB [bacterium]|nr:SMC-Scp complex subunit ScpB [bacterium]